MVERAKSTLAAVGLAFTALGCASCGAKARGPGDAIGQSSHEADRPVQYAFDSLDARRVSTDAFVGKPTVLAFVTTWDLSSQAQIDFLVPMSKHDGDKINYVMIALQEPKDRELVEAFRSGLHIEFPVALADTDSISGGGPFGDVHNVPTVIILDRQGRVVWRRVGLAKNDEIRSGFKGL